MRARAVIALLAGTTMAGAGAIAAPTAFAAPAKPSGPEQHVIVLLRDQHPESPALAGSVARRAAAVRSDQAPLQRSISRLGGSTTHAFTTLNAVAATLPTTSVATFGADPAVADVVPDLVWKAPRPAHESAQAGTSSQAAGSQQVCPSSPAHPLLEPEALQLTHTNSDSPTELDRPLARLRRPWGQGRLHRRRHRPEQPRLHPRRRQPRLLRLPGLQRFRHGRADVGCRGAPRRRHDRLAGQPDVRPVGLREPGAPAARRAATSRSRASRPARAWSASRCPNACCLTDSTIIQAIEWAVSHDHVNVLNESFGSNPYPDTADRPGHAGRPGRGRRRRHGHGQQRRRGPVQQPRYGRRPTRGDRCRG